MGDKKRNTARETVKRHQNCGAYVLKTNESFLEENLIGGLFLSAEQFPEICSIVKPTDFTIHAAVQCWLKMREVYDNGNIDMARVYVSLSHESDKQWLISATTEAMAFDLIGKAKKIAELSKKRRIKAELLAIAHSTEDPGSRPDWILEDVVGLFKRETGEVDRDSSIQSVTKRYRLIQARNKEQGFVGMATGFELLGKDHIVYQPGHLWVVGGWTSTGKSAFMIEAVTRFFSANENGKVAIFSTEMTEEQNVARLLANRSGINANVILSGRMLDNHKSQVEADEAWIESKNLHIYDKLRNVDDIMAQCRKLKFSGGVDVIWLDFIQNVHRPGESSQYVMMSQIAKDLQALAHDLRCTIVCLSQLPNHAGREDTGILEFKGAGEIAAACDIGVLMKRSKEDNSTILFDVRKNRHGKCGKYLLQFDAGWTRIIEKEAIA